MKRQVISVLNKRREKADFEMNTMKTTSAILLALLVSCHSPQVQHGWPRTYGGPGSDFGYSVQQTSDGGYVVAGVYNWSRPGFNPQVYLIKTNASGDAVWTRTYGGKVADEGYSVRQTSDGGYIVTGCTWSFRDTLYGDVYLIKTNTSGDTLWTRTFGGKGVDKGESVRQTSDGGYIVAGFTSSFGAGGLDVYLIKTNASGDTLWTRVLGGTSEAYANSVQQTSDGGYVIAGVIFGHVYLIKTNSSGDTLWTRIYGGANLDEGYSVQQTSDGGYIVAGDTRSFGAGGADVYLIKTNASGDTLWTRTYGGTSDDQGYSVQQTSDGGYIIAGTTESFGAGGLDVYLIKTNASGDTLWTRTYGGTKFDCGYSVQQTSDGGYVVAGYTYSFGAGGSDVYLIKTDANGNVSGE
jgi:hypothetical protein